jgi:hypothetical protein
MSVNRIAAFMLTDRLYTKTLRNNDPPKPSEVAAVANSSRRALSINFERLKIDFGFDPGVVRDTVPRQELRQSLLLWS